MLRREKEIENIKEPEANNIKNPKSISPVQSSSSSEDKTVIGKNIFIEGNIRGEEHLSIEGSMKGKIEMGKHNFSLGPNGQIEGEILAQNVGIRGQMKGTVKAHGKVEIKKDADIFGDIKAISISVEEGAYFKGTIELDREPHRKAALARKPIEMVVSQLNKSSPAHSDRDNKLS